MDSLLTSVEKVTEAEAPEAAAKEDSDMVSISDFGRIQLRVAQIIAAERVSGSEKLLKLQVDLGQSTGPRQIVAGIGKQYEPEAVVGRKIVVIANLKPAKLMGNVSEGMLLAASDNAGNLELLSPGHAMPVGSVVR